LTSIKHDNKKLGLNDQRHNQAKIRLVFDYNIL